MAGKNKGLQQFLIAVWCLDEYLSLVAGPRIFFQRVPEPKELKNRVHLDVNVGGPRGTPDKERRTAVDAAVERAIGLGAKKVRFVEERGERHYVMNDIEGNEFCLQ